MARQKNLSGKEVFALYQGLDAAEKRKFDDLWDRAYPAYAMSFHLLRVSNSSRQKKLDHRTRKPSNTERDNEIVRLRDQEGLTFGQIGLRLRELNKQWCAKDGRPYNYDRIERAYGRQKKRLSR